MKKQSYAVLSAAITATLLGGVVPALANDAVVTVDKTKTTDEKSVEAQQQGVYQAVSQLMTHSDKAVAVKADAAADTAAVVAEKAADDTTTSTNKTAVDNNGFYVKNGLTDSYNSLTDMGLWVGGTDANTGFRVDTDGNVNTTGMINGFTFTQDGTWTDHYGNNDTVDMINGVGFGKVGTPYEGTLYAKDLIVTSYQNAGMTGGYVYLADGSEEKNNGASTAIGSGSAIWGDNSVAIGSDASVEMNMDKPETDANGDPYPGYQGTAIGAYSKVAAQNGSAFGYQAEVYQENGVALGSESTVAEGDTNVVSVGHKNGDTYLGGALQYDSDLFRRITNVAAGVNPEDAVTVGQLKDIKDLATSGIAKWDKASNGASINGQLNGVTLKDGDVNANAITAKQFLAVGSTDGSLGNAAFGVDGSGNVTMNGALNGFTFTQDGTWTDHYGNNDTVDMINGVGFGKVGTPYEGTLYAKDLIVTSYQNAGMTGGYVYLADGSEEKNNGASTAIGSGSAIWGDNSVAIGSDASVEMNMDKPETDAEGNAYSGYQGTAIGAYSKVAAQNGSAFGYQAEVYQENGVALGSESTVAEGDTNVVSVGHKNGDTYLGGSLQYDSDLFRRITNVAAGVNPEDAVTVGQLKDNKDLATSGIAKWDEASNGASQNGVLNGVTLKNGNVTATDLTVKTINGNAANKLANVDEVDAIIGHSVSKPETFILNNGGKSLIDGINSNTTLIEKNATSITNITDGLKTAFAGVDFKKLQEISKVDTKSLIAPTSYSLSLASTVPTSALLAEGDRPAPGEGSDSGTVTRPQPGDFDSVTTTGNATVGGDLAVKGSATVSKDLTVNGTSNLNGNVNVGKDLTVTGKTNLKGDTTVDGKLTIKNEKGDGTIDVASAIDKNQTAITEQGKAISTLGQGLSSLGKEVDSVGAISAALAGLHPLDYNGNSKFQLSAAVGMYDGTQAMAFGGFYHANPNVLLSLGASTSFGGERKTAGNFGVTFRVGSGVSESPTVADNAALQDKLQKQQDQLSAQQKEIEELKAMVQNLTK